MRRVRHQPPSTLRTEDDAPVPTPGPGELLVRTRSIGVTLPMVRKLREATAPLTLGGEIAGIVEALGPEVTGYSPGDHVTGLCFADSYAEFALLPTAMASPVPDQATADDAVALVRSGLVALGALEAARPRPGERVLITAAASGVGHLALQLARVRAEAAHVTAAVGDPAAKADFLHALGADEVLPYAELPRDSYDYILDAVGGDLLTPAVRALAPEGRLIAYSSGGGTLPAHELLLGGKTVTGFQIARIARNHPATYATWRDTLWELFSTGSLRPAVSAAFPLDRAAEAHSAIESRTNLGKVVLHP